jgi:CBS domain-containing protein
MRESTLLLPPRTAGDLMTREVRTLPADMTLTEAVRQLAYWGVRGAPVVDTAGRCVGVLSGTDLNRWVADRGAGRKPLPRTCSHWEGHRTAGGEEVAVCRLDAGACPFQRTTQLADGREAVTCSDPHCVPTDWQVVEEDAGPQLVRDLMTTEVIAVGPDSPAGEMARVMLDRRVHRLLVLDPDRRPVGLVAVDDLLRVLAYPDLVTGGVR